MKNRMNKIAAVLLCTGAFGSFGVHAEELAKGNVSFIGTVVARPCTVATDQNVDFGRMHRNGTLDKNFTISVGCEDAVTAPPTIKFTGSTINDAGQFSNAGKDVAVIITAVNNNVEMGNNVIGSGLLTGLGTNNSSETIEFSAKPVIGSDAVLGVFSVPVTFTIDTP